MLKREIKINFKSFIVWSLIMIFLFAIVFAVYPSLTAEKEMLDQMLTALPEGMLEMFNMDVIGVGTVMGWILTEGFMLITLLGGCYFTILGSSILLKEIDEGTIDFIMSKPISKNKVINSKLITGYLYIIGFNLVLSLTILIGLLISNDFDFIKWFLISTGPIFICSFFFVLSFYISLYIKKVRKSLTIGLGIMFITYLFSVISTLSEKIEFLKYLSPFYYINSRTIIKNNNFELINVGIITLVTLLLIFLIYKKYQKKELGI